jgi:hypothetical protein
MPDRARALVVYEKILHQYFHREMADGRPKDNDDAPPLNVEVSYILLRVCNGTSKLSFSMGAKAKWP